MIYFFEKDDAFVQCEIHPGLPHVLKVIDTSGVVHAEAHASAELLEERWRQVRARLAHDGWRGPFGRDPRS